MKYEIWSNISYRYANHDHSYLQFLNGYRPEAHMEKSWEADFASFDQFDQVEGALSFLFALFNHDHRPNRHTAHSLSIGDVIVLQGLGAWAVAPLGFEKLDYFSPRVAQ